MTVITESHRLSGFSPRPGYEDDTDSPLATHGLLGGLTLNTRDHVRSNIRQMAFLDGLRGMFTFFVYMHYQTPFFLGTDIDVDRGWGADHPEGWMNRWLASFPIIRLFYTGGNAAVAVFFVHSGYVLSRSVLLRIRQHQHEKCTKHLISAFIRQSIHLYLPPIGFSLIQAILMHLPLGLAVHSSIPQPQPNVLLEIGHCAAELIRFLNPLQSHGLYMDQFPYNPVLWTYPIELKGSVLVLAIIGFFNYVFQPRYRQRFQLPLLSFLAIVLLLSYQWTMALFVVGMLLCVVDVDSDNDLHLGATFSPEPLPKKIVERPSTRLYTFVLVLGLLLMGQPSRVKNPRRAINTPGWAWLTELTPELYYSDEFYRFYQSIGAVIVMYVVLRLRWLQQFLSLPPFQYLGRIAYSLYLVNVPVLWIWGERMQRLVGWKPRTYQGPLWTDGIMKNFPPDIGMPGFSTLFWIVIVFTVPVLLLVSNWTTRWLDDPSVQLGKLVSVKLGCERKGNEGSPRALHDYE